MLLTIIDRYVLRQALVVVMATILIGLLVLSAARFLIIFDLVLGNDQGLLIVARMLGAFLPHYLAFMLPLALYWGSYTTVRQMAVGSEAVSLQATGVPIGRTFRVLLILGLAFAALNVAVVGWLQPLGRYSYRALTYRLEKADFYLRIRDGTFMQVGPRTVFIEKINPDRRSFEKILIYEPLDKGGGITIMAKTGEVTPMPGEVNLRLHDGQRLVVDSAADPDAMQMMDFAVLDVPLGNALAPFRPRGEDEQELLLPELLVQTRPLADASVADISANTHKRLVIALSCLFLPMMAVALGVQSARRKNIYQSIVTLLVIIVYHQLVEFAGDAGKGLAIGPAVPLWLTFGAFFGLSVLLFYKTTTGIGTLQDRASALVRWWPGPDLRAWRGRPQTP